MSSFGNNNQNQGWGNNNQGGPAPQQQPQQQQGGQAPQYQGKEDAPNKIRFSSVKMGQTKQGSPTLGVYLRPDQMVKLRNLLDELLNMKAEGAKLGLIIINGKKYDSGYAYVNPKEQRADNQGQGQGQGNGWGNRSNGGGYGQRQNTGNDGREAARSFMQGKRLGNGEEEGSGN